MENIYDLLRKHFLGETSAKEEKLVQKFIDNNFQEYKMLYNLWWSNVDVNVKEYNTDAAWQNVLAQVGPEKTQTIPLYTRIGRIAAALAFLVVSTFTIYYLTKTVSNKEMVAITQQIEKNKEIILSDGSKIWLNKNTQLSYPKDFKGDVRKVSLEGEAYFEIAKNPEKPFIIETTHSEIMVLGTSFNINTDSEKTDVSVATGKVKVTSQYDKTSVNLLPDDMATVTSAGLNKSSIENPNYLSWKTGKFVFNDTPLKDVVRDLNSFYNKQIIFKDTTLNSKFSAEFDNADLSEILEILELTCDISINENENNYEIQ